ncbi:unnamed protein product [Gordionus sp. m RMFG-2023]|uniref:uncharacterized protein LOC135931898 n=1 Tax=Gordionus sp. m RMFG-2023 TaxID=3053472 RepID=UPI0030DE667C
MLHQILPAILVLLFCGTILAQNCEIEYQRRCQDLCQHLICDIAPNAKCIMNDCGRCEAEFFINRRKIHCPSYTTKDLSDDPFPTLEPLVITTPEIIRDGECPIGVRPVNCVMNPCIRATCPKHPNARCRVNNCGRCIAEFVDANNVKLDCRKRTHTRCANLNCIKECPFGRVKDAHGCETCNCINARF